MNSKNRHGKVSCTDDKRFASRVRGLKLTLSALLLVISFACSSTPDYEEVFVLQGVMDAYLADKPPELHPLYQKVLREGQRNLVLNQMQAGLAAMQLGATDAAERSFDNALLNIEAVYTNDENAQKAISLWYEEGRKNFKGEPYERAMAYYYRGLLYLMRGDYENARACFKSGLLQDAMAEEAMYRADFALLIFLEGWASHLLGDRELAREAFAEVKQLRPDFTAPSPGDNVLLIAETGRSPRKVAVGEEQSMLVFQRGFGFSEETARFRIGLSSFPGYAMEDIYWQASTRGGRAVDSILAGKVRFKRQNEQMGDTLTALSVTTLLHASHFGDDAAVVAIAAGIVGVVGLTQKALASNTQTRADTRFWKNLPDGVHVYTFQSNRRDMQVEVSFHTPDGSEITHLRKKQKVHFIEGPSGIAWVRARSALLN